jgi:hypothetical protein
MERKDIEEMKMGFLDYLDPEKIAKLYLNHVAE